MLGLPNWPAEHMSGLLRRIEGVLPPDDQMAHKSRTDKLNWNEVFLLRVLLLRDYLRF